MTTAERGSSAPLVNRVSRTAKGGARRDAPIELDLSNADYVPLPPSPPRWEVDGRDEFHREYNDPALGPIFRASFQRQPAKVVKLAAGLPPERLQGRAGEEVAKAFRTLLQRMTATRLAAAARLCSEMFERVPAHVRDEDRRRFNRLLAAMDKAGKKHSFAPVPVGGRSEQPLFTVAGVGGWILAGERRLTADERPDPGLEVVAIDAFGSWLVGAGRGGRETVLRRESRSGTGVAERTVAHDAYRIGLGAGGSGLAIMDSNGVLHIYDATLNVRLETDLRTDRRVTEHFRTINTSYWGKFKSQVRAIDVAPDAEHYLFTLADEAWCSTLNGRTLWGVSMPLKQGWQRVQRTERFGLDRDVDDALSVLGLALPVTPVEVKRRYRALALAHHPDLNHNEPRAGEMMKALNRAFEVLTGVDPASLELEESDTTYFARSEPDVVLDMGGVRVGITIGLGTPQDWVYAASFAATDGGAYVATYSGKVILLSRGGIARIVYDLGTCPLEIVDVGRHVYFLTSTRLYVIEDGMKPAALVDVFQQGRLVTSQSGFGLLTSKRLQWFTAAGKKIGEVSSRDPIRTLYASDGSTIVRTRQHQVEVKGLVM